jgi:hypothetical protein
MSDDTPEPAPESTSSDVPEVPASEPVSLDSISNSPVEVPPTQGIGQSRLESEALAREHERAIFLRELGWLGRPFGGRKEKPGNISALVIVACFSTLFVVWGTDTCIQVFLPAAKNIDPIISFDRL